MPPVPNVVSSAPFAFSRAAWMFPPSGPENPPSRSLPLDSTMTPVARLTAPQLNSFLPSAENVVSSFPLAFRRVIATCWTCESPTTTILPSGCSAAANARSSSPPKSIVRLPRVPNVVSSRPLLRSRATQNAVEAPPLPARTILPFGCTSTAWTSSVPPKLIAFFPFRRSSYRDHPGLP